jgi:hypothetical protein
MLAGRLLEVLQSALAGSSQPMSKFWYAVTALGGVTFALAAAALAASDGNVPPTDLFGGLPALLRSGEFMAGIAGGFAVAHLVHLLWRAGQRAVFRTFLFGRRTLQYGVAAALLGGLILMI